MQCPAAKVKLWRGFNKTAATTELYCSKCGAQHAGVTEPVTSETKTIGKLIPAIPTEENQDFWGTKGVPQKLLNKWNALPLEQGGEPGSANHKPAELLELMVEYVDLNARKGSIETRLEEIKEQVDAGLELKKTESFASGGYKAEWGTSSWTDNKALIEENGLEDQLPKYKRTTACIRITGPRKARK